MSSILVIEPHCEGHHMHYARWIVSEAVSCGHDVSFATSPYCLKHPGYAKLREECGERVEISTLPLREKKPDPRRMVDLIRQDLHYYRVFSDCYRRLSQDRSLDYVFLPYDYCLYTTAILGSGFGGTPWGGIILRPTFHLREMGMRAPGARLRRAKTGMLLRLLRKDRTLRAAYAFDESLIGYVLARAPDLIKRLRFLPEPVELDGFHSRESARRALGIPQDAIVALVYGVLDPTKGIDALLNASARREFPEEVSLLLAGPQNDAVRELLDCAQASKLRENGRLHEHDRFLHGNDEHAVFKAADLVWIGYRGQYVASAVSLQAAKAGLPIVACEEGLIGWMAKNYGLGIVVDVSDTQAVAGAISALARDRKLTVELRENGHRLAARHSVQNFRRKIREEVFSGPSTVFAP